MNSDGSGWRRIEQVGDHVGGGVRVDARFEKTRQLRDLIAGRQQRQFAGAVGSDLAETGVSHQPVAKTFATIGILGGTAFAHVIRNRFGGAAVADSTIRFPIDWRR